MSLIRPRIIENCMAVAERAADGILPGQADRNPIFENGGERQFLGGCPVDPDILCLIEQRTPPLYSLHQFRVEQKILWKFEQGFVQLAQAFERDRRLDLL